MSSLPLVLGGVIAGVKDSLRHDIVSFGELIQIARDCGVEENLVIEQLNGILAKLSGDGIEIGEATLEGNRVVFIAWVGSVSERCAAARRKLKSCATEDRPFAFWLCRRDGVDRYEADHEE